MIGKVFIAALRLYKLFISPLLPPACRFYPTCSAYTAQAIAAHGPAWGVWLGVLRILRCNPWHEGGVDLVPEQRPAFAFVRPHPPCTPAAGRHSH